MSQAYRHSIQAERQHTRYISALKELAIESGKQELRTQSYKGVSRGLQE